ncbi:MAG: hypothetical protein HY717_01795 [Planctomycetes bacterium]|nr:hypothetical protein [Planctomycetota bacterium]
MRDPVVLEARSFQLYFDRKDSTFRLEDRKTGLDWHGPLDRRGFASLLLPQARGGMTAPSPHPPPEGTVELPVDQVEDLQVEEKSIRFRGRSSKGDLPPVTFELRLTDPLVGLEIAALPEAKSWPAGARLKLIDRGLWVSGAEGGGALLPLGLGEWRAAQSASPFSRRFALGPPAEAAAGGAGAGASAIERAMLAGFGLLKGNAGLVASWEGPEAVVEAAGRKNSDYPGDSFLAVTVTAAEDSRSLRLYPLGRIEVEDLARSYKQLVSHPEPVSTLRAKTGAREEQRALLGAAIFRVDLKEDPPPWRRFEEVAAAAARLKKKLDLDQALFLIDGWLAPTPADLGAGLRAAPEAGGDDGLARAAKQIQGEQLLVGLVVPSPVPAAGDENLKGWEGALEDLQRRAAPDLLFLAGEKNFPPPRTAAEWKRREAQAAVAEGLAARVAGLVGGEFFSESQFRRAAYLEGLLDPAPPSARGSFYPFLPLVYGQSARLAAGAGRSLSPEDPEAFLDFLLLGEVPAYRLPGKDAPAGGSPALFGREEGWFSGKGLSPEERFLKGTYEVLTHVARTRFREPLHFYRRLTEDGAVEEIYYGFDLRIVTNRGDREYRDDERGFTLPKYGFWVQHPLFVAFHATRAFEVPYDRPALFTVRSLEGKLYLRAEAVRIWHGLGPDPIRLGGKDFTVPEEKVVKIW